MEREEEEHRQIRAEELNALLEQAHTFGADCGGDLHRAYTERCNSGAGFLQAGGRWTLWKAKVFPKMFIFSYSKFQRFLVDI